jgi:pyruvate/2-oxoglutarate dehydrogenase complex dihydrolipoamide acyltransferase (E2) component
MSTPPSTDLNALLPWHEADAIVVAAGDSVAARQWLAPAVGDDAALAALRRNALLLADGTDLSRLDDPALFDHLGTVLAEGRLRTGGETRRLLKLVQKVTSASPPPPPPPASAPRAAPAAPPPVVETTFGSELDVAAMVAVLVQAAQDGVPFCEECARAAAASA